MVNIDVNQIKRYNESLREYQDKSSKIQAEIEFNQKELDRLCTELSAELGVQITIDNVEAMYTEYANKINNTVSTGTEILNRIASGETELSTSNSANANMNGMGSMMQDPKTPTSVEFSDIQGGNTGAGVLGGLPPMFSNI